MIFRRKRYLDRIKKFLDNTDKILFLVWARQVWKTTILKSLVKFGIIKENEVLFINWDQLDNVFNNGNDFLDYLEVKYNFSESIKYLIIDEFHFIKNIWIILKNLIDNIRLWRYKFKIVCSWSWSWNIFKWNTDSLIWRYDLIKVYPFSFGEFVEYKWINFNSIWEKNINLVFKDLEKLFKEYLFFWWYPEVVLAKSLEEKRYILANLLETYLYKDVSLLLKEWDFINFKKFLKLIASKLWSVYSISNLAAELGISRYIFEKYLFIVENTFLVYRLSWLKTGEFSWEVVNKEKVYFNDIWFLRYILWGIDFIWEFKGKVIENFVFNHLILNLKIYQKIYYRRRRTGAEIDFVIYDNFEGYYLPIEVKSWKKDNISKALLNFLVKVKNVKEWIIFYWNSPFKQRKENNKLIKFYPYFLTEKIDF